LRGAVPRHALPRIPVGFYREEAQMPIEEKTARVTTRPLMCRCRCLPRRKPVAIAEPETPTVVEKSRRARVATAASGTGHGNAADSLCELIAQPRWTAEGKRDSLVRLISRARAGSACIFVPLTQPLAASAVAGLQPLPHSRSSRFTSGLRQFVRIVKEKARSSRISRSRLHPL